MTHFVSPEKFAEQRAARKRGWKKLVGNGRDTKELQKREHRGAGKSRGRSNAGPGSVKAEGKARSKA